MEERALSFFVNGNYRGVAFVNLPEKGEENRLLLSISVYPTVSLTWNGDCARLKKFYLIKSEWPAEVKEICGSTTYQEEISRMKNSPEEQWQFRSTDRIHGDNL